jgi:hypothetical protein
MCLLLSQFTDWRDDAVAAKQQAAARQEASGHAAVRQEDSVLLSASTVEQLEFYFLDSVMIFPSRPLWKIVASMIIAHRAILVLYFSKYFYNSRLIVP